VSIRRGPELPYTMVAGVTSCAGRWLVSSAKMAGSTFAPEAPKLYDTFLDVLSEKPAYAAVVINVPIGYLDKPSDQRRTCDREARKLLGRRGSAIQNAPTWAILNGDIALSESGLDAVSATLLPRYKEVAAEMSPFRQRTIYEGNPELSFYQLNLDTPLHYSKRIESGRDERYEALRAKIPGIERVLDASIDGVPQKHLYDAAALLWSARRVFGHAAKRIPVDPEWDSEGIRMELVY
jgi:predicted RNase H-like nuclease